MNLRRYVEEGSEAAFAELVKRRIGLVYAIAWRRTRDAHRAEDVTQVVFIALARKAPQLVGHQTLVGWLYRSTHFAASDAVRVARRQQCRGEEAMVMHQLESDIPDPDWQTLSPAVDELLTEMPARDRDAVLLRVVR
jgi:RNA polymerase sigma factor (sigma-70 family)